jgi:radical SAM superfamily enzyme YgiQ (UPF0313 family)
VPGETYKDYLLTKKLMDKLKPYSHSFNVFVGIPVSSLYRHVLDNNLYEHIDEVGLVYLPGYDIKAKFFYGMDSKCLVDYEFKQRTDFDKRLLRDLYKKKMANLMISILPNFMVKVLKGMKHILKA